MKFLKLRSIIISFCFLLTAIVLCLDNQPQQFPLPDDAESPDCLKIDILNISKDTNRILISMRALPPFIEFPIEAAPHLIKIVGETSTSLFSYFYNDFWDFNASYEKIDNGRSTDYDYFDFNFNILQTINGNVSISVFCNQIKLEKYDLEDEERVILKNSEQSYFSVQHQNSISTFNFSIDEIRYYPIGWSKIESLEMNSFKFSGFSILKSNLIFHSTTISEIKPFKFGPYNYNFSIDVRNSVQFCGYSNQSYYVDEVFIISSQSIKIMSNQLFMRNCILRMYFTMLKIDGYKSSLINETINITDINKTINNTRIKMSHNLNENSISKINNQSEVSLKSSKISIKLLIINDTLDESEIENESLIVSKEKYQIFENLFGPNSIEIINMDDRKCFREGIFFPLEDNITHLSDDLFLSKIGDDAFNISLLKDKFIFQNYSNKFKSLTDSIDISHSSEFTLLNISDNISEILNLIYNCDLLIISKQENLPFALFMHNGAELIQINGNKFVGEKLSALNNLTNFKYYDDLNNFLEKENCK